MATVHRLNNTIALQGVLALLAFALLLVVAAHALQPLEKGPSDPAYAPAVTAIQEPAIQKPALQEPQGVAQDAKLPSGANAEPAAAFHGTIVKDGSDFVLRDQAGTVYRLDTPAKAKPFEGKAVKLTGKLEKNARLIHVQDIQGSAIA